jgi:hypothetical protein
MMKRHADDVTIDYIIRLRKLEQENERLRMLGLQMRNAQKKYFKERTQENLIASKQAEKDFDVALKEQG